jgi:threonyl-tRNA synthetase
LYQDDLKKIEKEMDRIIKKKLPIRQEVVSREEAKRHKFSKVSIQ